MAIWSALLLGVAVGVLSGLLGIGGGVVLVPALIYLAGFSHRQAIGTTLAVMVPPFGFFAALEYYRHNSVNIWAAAWIGLGFAIGAWFSAGLAERIPTVWLVRMFAALLFFIGARMLVFSDRGASVMADAGFTWLAAIVLWLGALAAATLTMLVLRRASRPYGVRPHFGDFVKRMDDSTPRSGDFQI